MEPRWDLVDKAMEIMESGFKKKMAAKLISQIEETEPQITINWPGVPKDLLANVVDEVKKRVREELRVRLVYGSKAYEEAAAALNRQPEPSLCEDNEYPSRQITFYPPGTHLIPHVCQDSIGGIAFTIGEPKEAPAQSQPTAEAGVAACHCDVFNFGCSCGQMERERSNA